MKVEKQIPKDQTRAEQLATIDIHPVKGSRPIWHQHFGDIISDKQAAERRTTLAALKIYEIIVSGQVLQLPGEDYFMSACRLLVDGLRDIRASTKTKLALAKAFAELKPQQRWATTAADIAKMRQWRGKRAPIRAVLLLTLLQENIGPVELVKWLERPNPNLAKHAPINFMRKGKWSVLADFIDDMLAGAPT